jgi:hypothetical protein
LKYVLHLFHLSKLKAFHSIRFQYVRLRRPKVGVVILSNSASASIIEMTQRCIDSVMLQNYSQCEILVVESGAVHQYGNATVIKPSTSFNYNRYLQLGIEWFREHAQVESYLFLNNDILCFDHAIDHLMASGEQSSCPVDPLNYSQSGIVSSTFGYSVRYHLVGWAICASAKLVNQIGSKVLFPDELEFFYQDDYYVEVLKQNKIRHAVVPMSKILHFESKSHFLRPDFSMDRALSEYTRMLSK